MAGIDTFIQVAVDGAGKMVRNFSNLINGQTVYQQVVTRAKSDGTLMEDEATETTLASLVAQRADVAVQCEVDGSGNLVYYGVAAPGSATSAAVWAIRKLVYDGSGNFLYWLWANGVTTRNQIWDGHGGLAYS